MPKFQNIKRINKLWKIDKLFFLLFFLFPQISQATVSILSWEENTNLTSSGKNSEIIIRGQVKNIASNEFLSSFTIGFDNQRDMKITKAFCDYKPANYSFKDNALNVRFTENKGNNSTFVLYLSYEEKYKEINEFLRQELIYIPNFAAKSKAKVVINFPGYLESATLNPNITKSGNSFIYVNNNIPAEGISEIIKVTPTQTIWDVAVKVKMNSNKALGNIKVTTPAYFQNGGQKVEKISTTATIQPSKFFSKKDSTHLEFNTEEKEITIKNKAQIYAQTTNKNSISRNPANYLEVSREEELLLSPILEEIIEDPQYKNFPLYAKIGKFVHKFIKYDDNYVGKLPKIKEILQNPSGVCTEYATLFNALARIAKIPSIVIEGAACGEYNKCQGHAWNMIYNDNQWIDVDPTWDLMSGIVSSSHIYFNDTNNGEVSIQYVQDREKIVDYKLDFEMKSVKIK